MYTWIKGSVLHADATRLEIRCGGLAYQVAIPPGSHSNLVSGDDIILHLATEWRDDGPHLYGFSTCEMRMVFFALRTIRGVGPKLALHILARHDAGELASIVYGQRVSDLQRIPGVGPRLAQRIVHELPDLGLTTDIGKDSGTGAKDDARLALLALGYASKIVEACLKELSSDRQSADWDVQMWVRRGLQLLAAEAELKSKS